MADVFLTPLSLYSYFLLLPPSALLWQLLIFLKLFAVGLLKGRNILDEHSRRVKSALLFISVSVPSRQAPDQQPDTPAGDSNEPDTLVASPSIAQSDNLFKMFNPQTFVSDVSNSWCGFHQCQKEKKKRCSHMSLLLLSYRGYCRREYLEWFLHGIMVWPSGIMGFLGTWTDEGLESSVCKELNVGGLKIIVVREICLTQSFQSVQVHGH